jgi:predicted ATP-grasp superfamily ATP-dependent carboligase
VWNVLVTDGNQRAALAVTRSLGQRGVKVITADTRAQTLGSASKYAWRSDTYAAPGELESFLASIKVLIERYAIKIIIPITEITLFTLLQHREEFADVIIPFDSFEKISLLSDKAKLIDLCVEKGFPCPRSSYFECGAMALAASGDYRFPVVLKPYKSRIFSDGQWVSTAVTYASSAEELHDLCAHSPVFSAYPFIIQEYIEGHGQGVFLLCDHGKPIVTFCHKRLREKPPSGGVSVLSESIEPPADMLAIATELLKEVGWHGVAMVEFKVNAARGPFIMEVNTRFWGSLQLAIDAGVDFPYLLYQLCIGETPAMLDDHYKTGQRLRWLLGDLDRLYLVLKSAEFNGRQKLAECRKFLALWGGGMRYEVNRTSDLRPFVEEMRQYFAALFHKN